MNNNPDGKNNELGHVLENAEEIVIKKRDDGLYSVKILGVTSGDFKLATFAKKCKINYLDVVALPDYDNNGLDGEVEKELCGNGWTRVL